MTQSLRAWLELVRLPALFSAPADVCAGLTLVTVMSGLEWSGAWLVLIVVSLGLYASGMAANDLFDLKIDQEERPARPLPSGRIAQWQAWTFVLSLQFLSILLAYSISLSSGHTSVVLCSLTYLYNGVTKSTLIGPLVMGSCRAANLLLGLSLLSDFGWQYGTGWALSVIWLYVAAVTVVSRFEVEVSGNKGLFEQKARRSVVLLRSSGALALLYLPLSQGPLWLSMLWLSILFLWLNIDFPELGIRLIGGPVRLEVIRGLQGILCLYSSLCLILEAYLMAFVLMGLLVLGKQAGRRFYST